MLPLYLIISVFVPLIGALQLYKGENHVQVQVHHVEGHIRLKRSNAFQFPDSLSYTFSFPDGSQVFFDLKKVEKLNLDTPVKLVQDGLLVKYTGDQKENFALYQDQKRGSSILVMCESSTADYKLFGTFYHNNEYYNIQDSPSAIHPQAGKTHIVSKIDHKLDFNGDSKRLRQSNSANDVMNSDKVSSRRQKRSFTNHVIELLFYLDSSVYEFFMTDASNNIAAAIENIRLYYILTMNEMDLRYQSIFETDPTVNVDLMLNELFIAQTANETSWIKDNLFINGVSTYLDGSTAIDDFVEHTGSSPGIYTPFDHVMLFTRYDIARKPPSFNAGVVGYANLGAMCSRNPYLSVSVNEDPTFNAIALIASHELGHSLNATHDSTVGCDGSDLFIMAAVSLTPSQPLRENPWKFSTCSVNEITNFLSGVSCTQVSTYNETLYNEYRALDPTGQYFDYDKQCKLTYGPTWAFSESNTNLSAVCYNGIACRNPSSLSSADLRDGSPCEGNKTCYRGNCVTSRPTPLPVVPTETPDVSSRPTPFPTATPDVRSTNLLTPSPVGSTETPDVRSTDDPEPTVPSIPPGPTGRPRTTPIPPAPGNCTAAFVYRCPETYGLRQLCKRHGGSFCRNYWIC